MLIAVKNLNWNVEITDIFLQWEFTVALNARRDVMELGKSAMLRVKANDGFWESNFKAARYWGFPF